jgi:hypothetical protein
MSLFSIDLFQSKSIKILSKSHEALLLQLLFGAEFCGRFLLILFAHWDGKILLIFVPTKNKDKR